MLYTSLVLCLWTLSGVFAYEVKSVSVMEGQNVTLHADVTHIQRYDLIRWRFGDTGIASILRSANNPTYNNIGTEIFRENLKMNNQTGDLTITHITSQHSGLYHLLTLTSSERTTKSFSLTVNTHTTVSVSAQTSSSSSSSSSSQSLSVSGEFHFTQQHSIHSLYKVVATCVVGFLMTASVVFIFWINRKPRKTHGQGKRRLKNNKHCSADSRNVV